MNLLNIKQYGRCRREIHCAKTGAILSRSGWSKNLVFDAALNLLATGSNSVGFAGIFANCVVGSGNAANSVASGAITFTQVAMLITSSGGFFTPAMTGGILKYGVGSAGKEQYITYQSATTATVSTSFTVATPVVGTFWQVNQTALQTFLYQTGTYSTSAGANSTTFNNNVLTLQRTFVFPVQGSTYNVNEIGCASSGQSGGTCNNRIVLSTTDVITPAEFYVVVWQFTWTVSPGSPTSVANVGTGINTAGQVMFQFWDCQTVDPGTGNTVNYQANAGLTMDCCNNMGLAMFIGTAPALNSVPSTAQVSLGSTNVIACGSIPATSNSAQPVGVGLSTLTFTITTAGQVVTAFYIGHNSANNIAPVFVLNLATPFALPTGSFGGTVNFTNNFARTLIN